MDYQEFRNRIGDLSSPKDLPYELLEGLDSVHFMVVLGVVQNGEYAISLSPPNMEAFLDVVRLVEVRGAVRNLDYAICGAVNGSNITLGIHTNKNFLSDEDFDSGIKRIYTV